MLREFLVIDMNKKKIKMFVLVGLLIISCFMISGCNIQKLLKNAIALNRGIVRLAYFSDTPKPIAGPSNCEKCNDKFIKMFDEYRETLDPKVLFEEIQCECKKYIIR